MECEEKERIFENKCIIAVNVKNKKILSIKVTNEHVHDIKILPELVDEIIKSDNVTTICKLFVDGAYDSNNIFRYLAEKGVLSCIKVKKNAHVRLKKGHILRNLSIISQNDLKKWNDNESHEKKRWVVETVFSCIKITFGE